MQKTLHCCDDYTFAAEQLNYVIEDGASKIAFSSKWKRSKKDKTKEHRKENNYGLLNFYGSFSEFIINCKVRSLSLIG